jgi:hypothetical protein
MERIMQMPSLTDLGFTPASAVLTTRLDGHSGSSVALPLDQLNPRLRQTHQDWALGVIKRWNRGEDSVRSFRHDYFAGDRDLSHVESDVFTEVNASLVEPGISVQFLYLVRGNLRQTHGFQYEFSTSTLDERTVELAWQTRQGYAYGPLPRSNIQTVFELVQKLRTEPNWSLHWNALRFCLFDAEVNKWLI